MRAWFKALRSQGIVTAWMVVTMMSAMPAYASPADTCNLGRGEEAMDFSGRWVMVQKTVTVADVPVVGEIRSTTRAVVLYTLDHQGDKLRGAGELCELDIDSGSTMIRTVLPDAFKRSLATPKLDAVLKQEGPQLRLRQGRTWSVVGAKLEDPSREALPTSASDARVYDQDKDGKPGVTVRVEGIVSGEIYVVQRSWSELEAVMREDDLFKGYVRFNQEQVILDATKKMLKKPPNSRPDLNRSVFQLKRVDSDATCASIRRIAARL